VLVELVDPVSGEPVPPEPGATGELVYTSLTRECCPLVRFRTRDHVRVTGADDDGAPLIRCFGRTDDMLIVLGVNVFPTAIRDIVQEFRPRTSGVMQVVLPAAGPRAEPPLRVEVEPGTDPGDADLPAALEKAIRDRLSVRAEVAIVARGALERAQMKTQLTRITT
jgi:phenylacetate-CoA ligase